MDQLGLIDEKAVAQEQFQLINNWMQGNHPEYASIMDNVDALTQEHDKIELFFMNGQLDVSEDSLIQHTSDLKDWLRKTEEEITASCSVSQGPFPDTPCGCKKKVTKRMLSPCCCKSRQWLLWLALAAIFLILINLKQYVVAAIFAIAALLISQPKLLKHGYRL